jgi:hypothetical protein
VRSFDKLFLLGSRLITLSSPPLNIVFMTLLSGVSRPRFSLFYLELFIEKNRLYWISIVVLIINIGNYLAGFFLLIFECRPIDDWNHSVTFTCIGGYTNAIFVVGIVNIFTDFLIW